jgi:hypothetical protein
MNRHRRYFPVMDLLMVYYLHQPLQELMNPHLNLHFHQLLLEQGLIFHQSPRQQM